MFKNKKGTIKQEKSEEAQETFSLTSLDIPVMREETASSTDKTLDIVKEEKPKKPNVLWARILVTILILFAAILSLCKLVELLNMPKVRFATMIDSVYKDLSDMFDVIDKENLFNVLSNDNYEISIDTDMIVSNMSKEDAHLENVLNDLKYTSTIRVDRASGYLGASVSGLKNASMKFNLDFLEKEHKRYLNIPNMYSSNIELENNLDFIKFNSILVKRAIGTIKNSLVGDLENRKIESGEQSIGLNGKTVDCRKGTYVFTRSEIIDFLDKIYNSLKNDSTSYAFLSSLFGGGENILEEKYEKLKNDLGIYSGQEYKLSTYTKKDTDDGVKLELAVSFGNGQERTLSLNREFSYKSVELRNGNEVKGISLQGNLDKTFILNILGDKTSYSITAKPSENGKEGALVVVSRESNETLGEMNFSYTLKQESNTGYSMGCTFEYKDYTDNNGVSYKTDSKILINIGSVRQGDIPRNSVSLKEYEDSTNSTLKKEFRKMLSNISLEEVPNEPIEPVPEQPEVPDQTGTTDNA